MGFWVAAALFVASTVVSALLAPRPKDASASSLGDFQVPTAEEGRPVPLLLGTCKISGPNVTWWGHLGTSPIRRKSGMFSKTTVGYRYRLGMMLALTGPVDAITDILVGGKSLAASTTGTLAPAFPWTSSSAGQAATLDMPSLFGGESSEGGLSGPIHAYFGRDDQPADAYLASRWGGAAPAFRGLTYLRLGDAATRFYVGTSRYLKDWAIVARHCPAPAGLNATKANVDGGANAAYAIAWLLTLRSDLGGRGLSPARLDLASFQSAADTLHAEGLGINLLLDKAQSAESWMDTLCRVVDGVLFVDPSTGLWTFKLIRADYDPATLPEFTVQDALAAPALKRATWPDTFNQVVVRYTDRADGFSTRTVRARDMANLRVRGGEEASTTMDFLALGTAAAANQVAARELRAHAYPLARIEGLPVTRKAWELRPGSPVKISWPAQGYSGAVFRVAQIRYGTPKNPAITLDLVEDVFGLELTQFAPPPDSGWVDPRTAPQPVEAQALVELPHWLAGETRQVAVLAGRADGTSTRGEVWTNEGGGYLETGELESFTPTGTLATPWSGITAALDPGGFTVQGRDVALLLEQTTNADGRARGENLALVGNEWVSWTAATLNGDGSVTCSGVLRGVLDTVPEDHAAGERVWFATEGSALARQAPYAADLTLKAKVLPSNSLGTLALTTAPEMQLTTQSRAWRPMPPGNLQVNGLGGSSWPATTLGDAAFTWNHRARATQAQGAALVAQDATGSFALEGTYTLEVLVGGTVKRTFTSETGSSKTYTPAMRLADDADGTKAVQLRITPINGGLAGTPRTTPGVVMTGLGMTLGQNLGGIQA